MLKGILDFFRNLFSGLFGGGAKKPAPTTPPPPKEETTPPVTTDPPSPPTTPVDTDTPVVDPTDTGSPTDMPVSTENQAFDPQDGSDVPPDSIEVAIVTELEPALPDPEITLPEIPVTGTVTPPTATENEPAHQARYMWCLDNGHGSKTAGKRSPKLPDGRQLLEYRFNRDIVKRIAKQLEVIGVKHYIVVPEEDTDNFLQGRVTRANTKQSELPKLFVSVHANAAPAPPGRWCSPSIKGIETWYYHNSRRGKKLASVFQNHLVEKTGFKNRFIKSRPSNQFYVLRKTGMTAILTENGFYNNKEECLELLTDKVRNKIAAAHVAAILEVEKNGL